MLLKQTHLFAATLTLLIRFSSSFVQHSFPATGLLKKPLQNILFQTTKPEAEEKMSSSSVSIRDAISSDVENLKAVIDSSELFPSEMLDDMISGYLAGSEDCLWLTADSADPTLIAYCAPEKMTEGTWNLYLIAVRKSLQGGGIGTIALKHLEEQLIAKKGARVLLVETSALPEFGMFY